MQTRLKNFSQVQTKNCNLQYKTQPVQVNDWPAQMLEIPKWSSPVPSLTISSPTAATEAKADAIQEGLET